MSGFSIRPFVESDIPQAAGLHQRGFQLPERAGQQQAYPGYFRKTFLQGDDVAADCPSLVAVDSEGRIIGLLGVVTRPMRVEGAPIRAALSSQFVVDADSRTQLVGVALLKRFLAGPQDLSFTDEAGERSARIWECLGGERSPIHSLHWVAPLRPAELMLWRMKRRQGGLLPDMMRPLARAGDLLMTPIVRRIRDSGPVRLRPRPQDPESLIENLRRLRAEWPLAPDYKSRDVERLIAVARSRKRHGEFRSVSLETQNGSLAGWYMYYANARGLSEVIQIAARSGSETDVMAHLIQQAHDDGAAGLIGRMDPRFLHAVSKNMCALSRRQSVMLLHSRNTNLIRMITSGAAFLSRLEGEWCLRFD